MEPLRNLKWNERKEIFFLRKVRLEYVDEVKERS